jgi:hypothetical protein
LLQYNTYQVAAPLYGVDKSRFIIFPTLMA